MSSETKNLFEIHNLISGEEKQITYFAERWFQGLSSSGYLRFTNIQYSAPFSIQVLRISTAAA